MQILTKYVFFKFLRYEALAIVALISIYIIIDFLKTSNDFIANHAEPYNILLLYFCKIPDILFEMAPFTVLFSTISSLTSLSKSNEIIAMRACGKSLFSITTPILLFSFFFTILIFLCNDFIAPYTNQKKWFILEVIIRKKPQRVAVQQNDIWYHTLGGTIWSIRSIDPKARTFRDISVYSYNGGKSLSKMINASLGSHDGKDWIFENVSVFSLDDSGTSKSDFYKKRKFQFREKPDDFLRLILSQSEMDLKNINLQRKKLRQQGLNSTYFDVSFHHKIAYPFICIIMAIIGIPLSLKSSRSSGIIFAGGLSFFIGWIYFYVFSSGISFGHRGILPPWLAAWGINMLAINFGLYMILTLDSEAIFPSFKKRG